MATVERELEREVQHQTALALGLLSADEIGEEMVEELLTSMPEFEGARDEDFRAGLRRSCISNVRAVFELLGQGASEEEISPPGDATSWAFELVHRGMPLAALLRSYRLGHGLVERRFEAAVGELEVEPDVRWRVLAHASRTFFDYVDAVATQLVSEYEQEHARWIRGAAAARAELVRAIIEGDPVDARTATDLLRYDVSRRHLGFIVWSHADPASPAPRTGSLELAATALAGELGGGPVLLVPIGERVVWGWTSGDELRDEGGGAQPPPLPDGLRAAIGSCATGLEGMATSYEHARAARRVAELLGSRPGATVRYGTVALAALLTVEPAEAARFAVSQLGELAADTDAAARLRATLRVYLEENLSPGRTAKRLGIHQNTVTYRVRRAEEILGRPVEPGRLELEVSLRLSEGLEGLQDAARGGADTARR